MKKITLTPVTVPLPRDISSEVRMSVAKAEEAMRKNNRIIEDALYKQSSEFVYDLEENIEDVNDELHDLESYVSGMNSRIVPPELINMNNATPVLTYEFDNTASGYAKIFSRDNSSVTNIWDVRDEVAFRITVSGTGIDAVYDVYVKFKGVLVAQPDVWVYAKTRDTSASKTGLRYLRTMYPLTLNSGKPWYVEYSPYNATARHIKVEVFRTTPAITWYQTREASVYDAYYWTNATVTLYDRRGLITNGTIYGTASASSYGGYISTYLPMFMSSTMPKAGTGGIIKDALGFLSTDGVVYNTKATNKPINPHVGIGVVMANYSAGSALDYRYFRQKMAWSGISGDGVMTWDTFALGDPIYLRCTMDASGNILSTNHLSTVMSPGYTWVLIGIGQSASAINIDTCGKHFYTLDASGKLTHIDGLEIA